MKLMFWVKDKPLPPVVVTSAQIEKSEKDILFEVLLGLLDHPENWVLDSGAHNLVHESGIKLWVANRPYADMKIYEGSFSFSLSHTNLRLEDDVSFPDSQCNQLRIKADKIVRRLKLESGDPLTDNETVFKALRDWAPKAPEGLRDVLDVI
jgi:hypothetical protein